MADAQQGPVVVRHTRDAAVEAWDDPDRGRLRFRSVFDRDETPTSTLTTGIAELGPGDWLAVHRHPQAEAYHVLEGTGLLVADGEERRIGPGDSVFLPPDVWHGVSHLDGPVLRIHYAFAVDSLDQVTYTWR